MLCLKDQQNNVQLINFSYLPAWLTILREWSGSWNIVLIWYALLTWADNPCILVMRAVMKCNALVLTVSQFRLISFTGHFIQKNGFNVFSKCCQSQSNCSWKQTKLITPISHVDLYFLGNWNTLYLVQLLHQNILQKQILMSTVSPNMTLPYLLKKIRAGYMQLEHLQHPTNYHKRCPTGCWSKSQLGPQ